MHFPADLIRRASKRHMRLDLHGFEIRGTAADLGHNARRKIDGFRTVEHAGCVVGRIKTSAGIDIAGDARAEAKKKSSSLDPPFKFANFE